MSSIHALIPIFFPWSAYDKQEAIVITLNADGLKSENDLIRYLSLLLNHEMPVEQREKRWRIIITCR